MGAGVLKRGAGELEGLKPGTINALGAIPKG